MSRKHQLAAYSVRLNKTRARSVTPFQRRGEFDAFEYLRRYFADNKGTLIRLNDVLPLELKAKEPKVIKIDHVDVCEEGLAISGLVSGGETGREVPIFDSRSTRRTYVKRKHECEMPPFYFRVYVPDGADRALLLLQKTGPNGVKEPLEKSLRRYLHNEDVTVEFLGITHKDFLLDYLAGGKVREVRVVTHKQNNDPRALLDGSTIAGEKIGNGTEVQLVLRHSDRLASLAGKIIDRIKGGKSLGDIVEIAGMENPEDVLLDVQTDRGMRKLSITRGEAAVSYSLEDEVEVAGDGNPKFDSIDRYAKGLCRELAEKIYK